MQEFIEVTGAKVHNLKNISLKIPRHQLVVITGISGSGKSSLAFDTIYAEGQRRYMETFSAYARQFIGSMERPDVEQITGLSPVISIEQKTTGRNPRSTVGTITEIYDFIRLLYARIGVPYSPVSNKPLVQYTESQILDTILQQFEGQKVMLLAPIVRGRKGHYRELLETMRKAGYTKIRANGVIKELVLDLQLDRFKTHDVEVVIDRLMVRLEMRDRIAASLTTAMQLGEGIVFVSPFDTNNVEISNTMFSKHLMDPTTGEAYQVPSPNTFSFNTPYGACPRCKGLGQLFEADVAKVIPDKTKSINEAGFLPLGEVRETILFKQLKELGKKYGFTFDTPVENISEAAVKVILYGGEKSTVKAPESSVEGEYSYNLCQTGIMNMLKHWYDSTTSERWAGWIEDFMSVSDCPECHGFRLKMQSLHFKIMGKHIGDLTLLDIPTLTNWFSTIESQLTERQQVIAKDVLKEIRLRLGFLLDVGLDYLHLNRPAGSLSGGEAQRIRLATQIGSALTGITYILDEPSIGLHQRDNQKLIQALRHLTDIGNSVLVVEHDKDIMLAADYLIDLGPGAGKNGGELVGADKPTVFLTKFSPTADFLSGRQSIQIPKTRRTGNGKQLILKGATGNNLQKVDITIPLGTLTLVTGVSGSGKSTLINETLYPILRQHFYKSIKKPMAYAEFEGLEHLDKVIEIDQSAIGRTPRSNPATYIGVFTDVRTLFAAVPEAKIRGYKAGRFSFNVKGGRCEKCEGAGQRVIEMNFLPDVHVSCETCLGRRYNRETLEILYKGKSINDILNMSVDEATPFFEPIPNIHRRIKTLREVGLGYITLGQQATTLSGGEAQRVKLAEELSKKDTGNTLYILDEPTTGLHFQDIQLLLDVLNKLVDKGNTVIIIEHNMDVIKVADHIIDMGPEGGHRGGLVVCAGTPEVVAQCKTSHTGKFLKQELKS
jgi:excinuclease ABC subunit A